MKQCSGKKRVKYTAADEDIARTLYTRRFRISFWRFFSATPLTIMNVLSSSSAYTHNIIRPTFSYAWQQCALQHKTIHWDYHAFPRLLWLFGTKYRSQYELRHCCQFSIEESCCSLMATWFDLTWVEDRELLLSLRCKVPLCIASKR